MIRKVLLLLVMVNLCYSAKILAIYPTPSISHQVVFRPLTNELVKRGHEVIVITPDPEFSEDNRPVNLTEIDVHDTSYKLWVQAFVSKSNGNARDHLDQAIAALDVINIIFEKQMLTYDMQRILKDRSIKFDLLLSEAWYEPSLALSHIYNIPAIQVSSFSGFNNWAAKMGGAMHPFLYPDVGSHKIENLSMIDKLSQLYDNYRLANIFNEFEKEADKMIEKLFGPGVPSVNKLVNNVEMLFLNVHRIWDNNRPVPQSVLYMGGLHQKEKKDLPKDLKEYLDSSKNGVIYISFGTNVLPSMLPKDRIEILVNVLSQVPYDVLWKWDKDKLPGLGDNVKIGKWFPQSDLLKHPKLKLFITQCGLQSTDEAITAGVPMLGIPMLADQWYNVEMYKKLKIGERLDITSITEETFRNAIEKIIGDESYKKNIENLRDIIRDQPQSSLERAVWWTEYVIRHGGAKHLRSPAANMPWTQYYEAKLVLTLLISSLSILSVILFTAFKVYQSITSTFEIKVKSS